MEEQHSMEQKKADVAAIQSGHCPECKADLSHISAEAHAEDHWPDYPSGPPMGADAARRKKLVMNFHRQQQAGKDQA